MKPHIDLNQVKKVFFFGIGGIGVSAIARMMLMQGKKVAGSDISLSLVTEELEKLGATIYVGQEFSFIEPDTDLIIYTIALEEFAKELLAQVKACPIVSLTYPQMLGVVSEHNYTIAVSGTHGKTTTTAMIGKMLRDTKFDPTIVVGSFLKDEKSNFVAGKSKYFVVEACEYRRSFLQLQPSILVITNIDNDHLDYYKDMNDVQSAFVELVSKMGPADFLVCNPNAPYLAEVVKGAKCKVVDYSAFPDIELKVPGDHNRQNAKAAMAVAQILDIDAKAAEHSLKAFSGTWRRFEYKGTTETGVEVYDDYGHHPTEVKATLQGARQKFADKNITVIFQPHLYSRTKLLFQDFINAFSDADRVILLPIYAAREKLDTAITSKMLGDAIAKVHPNVERDMASFDYVEKFLQTNLKSGDVCITMGAGDVYKIGEALLAGPNTSSHSSHSKPN